MGLGPPVCTKCRMLMKHDPNRKGPRWFCLKCGIDCSHEDSSSLFCFKKEEADQFIENFKEHNARLAQ